MSHISPADLLALKSRDPIVLGQLFAAINPSLVRFLGAEKIHGTEAEDLIHQAWAVFFEKIESFEGRSSLRTYLTGILLNKVREQRRSQKREVPEEDVQTLFDQAFTPDGWWKTEFEAPDRLIEHKESARFIEECLEGLSPQQKEAFWLRDVDEEKSEDVCKILGVSVTHLGVLIFRAKDKLRKCLDGKLGGPR